MAKKKKEIVSSTPLKNMNVEGDGSSQIVTEKEVSQKRKDRIKSWVTFYRHNMSFFVEHYMGVKLFAYQRYWINIMASSTEFLGIASRAAAKSWLIAVYAIARCILYPGTTVALASSTKAQAGLIISEKCVQLHNDHPNIRRECSDIVTNQNKWEMTFHNGSKINVVISGEGGRGHRSQVTVLEERRLIPLIIIDSIIRPFLISRPAPYLKNPKYAHLFEEPQEIIITSAYYKSHEWWAEAKKLIMKMANGDKDTKGIFLDYLISLKHNIKTKKQMKREKYTLDPITFLMEYGNIPYGSSSTSFYKLGLFNRNVKRSWRPITDEDFISKHKNQYDIPKTPGEQRIVSVDVAMRAGSTNDNTIITCARLFPTRKGWSTEISYIESHNGKNTMLQALRVKQIFKEFAGDVLVLDVQNAGISLYDTMTSVTKDEIRGTEYEAYTVIDNDNDWIDKKVWEELKGRTLGKDAKPCIFPVSANAPLNSHIAVTLRDRLKRKLLTFLIDDRAEEEFLIKSENKDIIDQFDIEKRARLLQAHIQTTLLINEAIALDMTLLNGLIKLVEPSGARKDRYTSLAYLNYYVSLMDIQLLKDKYDENDEETFLSMFQMV